MIKKLIVVYPGRFQPFSKHHMAVYNAAIKEFGDVYIVTSDKTGGDSPLNFKDKSSIMARSGVPVNRIVQVKSPYSPNELTDRFDPNTTGLIFIVGSKDMDDNPRLKLGNRTDGSKAYLQKYIDTNTLSPLSEHGYVYVIPEIKISVGKSNLSGTSARALLKSKPTPETMKSIFGWSDPVILSMLKSRLKITESVITEGGSAGHMDHPFDIDGVDTGTDLLNIFKSTVESLSNTPATVKIDGVNASARLIKLDGKRQFVLDRGSNKELDINGVTKADLKSRFGDGHGMIKIGGIVLDILNASIVDCKSELKALGLWDNPNILLNIEYVAGSTNVIDYGSKFLAIHGLLEIKQVRPTKRATVEKPVSETILNRYIESLGDVATEFGYSVVGAVPAKLDKPVNFNTILNSTVEVNMGKYRINKPLKTWLSEIDIPKDKMITVAKGNRNKKIAAISREVLMELERGVAVSTYVVDPVDYDTCIAGFITYYATRELGQKILDVMSSRLGSMGDQEGIVIRDKSISNKPYKITGKFITKLSNSPYA